MNKPSGALKDEILAMLGMTQEEADAERARQKSDAEQKLRDIIEATKGDIEGGDIPDDLLFSLLVTGLSMYDPFDVTLMLATTIMQYGINDPNISAMSDEKFAALKASAVSKLDAKKLLADLRSAM